ncbi:MAG: gliding motility-associated protein GldE, partial [Bacteroidota bacterium]
NKGRKKAILKLIEKPDRLWATILISNTFINVAIVILSTFILNNLIDFSPAPVIGFIFQVIIITFLLLLFGEIIPKIYATQNALGLSLFMVYPLRFFEKLFNPLSSVLITSTSIVSNRFGQKKQNLTMTELSDAIDLTTGGIGEDKNILKGIVKFGNIDVREIMKSRVDVIAVDIRTNFRELVEIIIESGYSRIPIFEESLDQIKGILYIKDLLPHLHKQGSFKWQSLMRPQYYVPESKKINDLLKEFQTNKIHMAIVIDEYGGTSGIVTLEDVLEEIVGEIIDESDEDEIIYTKQDENTFMFEGKILLNDFYKITNSNDTVFEEVKGDAETLAGLILELRGEIPLRNDIIKYKNYTFTVESVDKRRIKQVKVQIEPLEAETLR